MVGLEVGGGGRMGEICEGAFMPASNVGRTSAPGVEETLKSHSHDGQRKPRRLHFQVAFSMSVLITDIYFYFNLY